MEGKSYRGVTYIRETKTDFCVRANANGRVTGTHPQEYGSKENREIDTRRKVKL